jgi:hypothetical protein
MIDIESIKHFEPKHTRMSMYNRAAQFAPFAALTGFYEQISDKEKIKTNRKILSSDNIDNLNRKGNYLTNGSVVNITYYKYDNYIEEKVIIKRVDNINKRLILNNRNYIYFRDIIDINICKE